jgi:hypothetical protein
MCSNNSPLCVRSTFLLNKNHEKKKIRSGGKPVHVFFIDLFRILLWKEALTSLTTRLVATLFSGIFTGDGATGYRGCDSTENRDQRLEQRP